MKKIIVQFVQVILLIEQISWNFILEKFKIRYDKDNTWKIKFTEMTTKLKIFIKTKCSDLSIQI